MATGEGRVMQEGRIKAVKQGFGFIETDSGSDVFFHASGVVNNRFAAMLEGVRVAFDVHDSEKGPRAENIRRLA